ncbi:PARP14 [Bugula neritina]|uniref:PARP14 n=1 Tax=Bugula neritina TaxID=10212 RepID=A0A7J7KGB4_BUGNE|nr:PARP14 [Bugula neritina]
MIEAMMEYSEANPTSLVKNVKLVIYPPDTKTTVGFQKEFNRLQNKPTKINMRPKKQTPPVTDGALQDIPKIVRKCSVKVNKTTVRILHGDLVKHNTDVLVNSTDESFSMDGEVSQALLSAGGFSLKQEIDKLHLTNMQHVLCLTETSDPHQAFGSLMLANSIIQRKFFISIVNFWEIFSLPTLITACLKECENRCLRSIAFPALGTGVLNKSTKEMSKLMLEPIIDYAYKAHGKYPQQLM